MVWTHTYVMGSQKERAGFGTGALGWHPGVVPLHPCSAVSSTLFACRAHLLWHRGRRRRNLLLKLWVPALGRSFQMYMV